MTYNSHIRDLVLKNYKEKYTAIETSKIFCISKTTIFNWKKNCNKTKNKNNKITPQIICFIRFYVIKNYNFNRFTLINKIKNKFNVTISKSSIYNIIKKLGIKKKKIIKKIDCLDKRKKRILVKELKNKFKNNYNSDIISIDETSFDSHLMHNKGWAEKGTNVVTTKQQNYIRYTALTAINNKKLLHVKLVKGSSNAEIFKDFLNELIQKINPKKSFKFFLDNARIHHSKIVKTFIETKQNIELIFNVPYMPEFNPIEKIFSIVKDYVRGKKLTSKNIIKRINASFKKIKKDSFTNCFKKSLEFLFTYKI